MIAIVRLYFHIGPYSSGEIYTDPQVGHCDTHTAAPQGAGTAGALRFAGAHSLSCMRRKLYD